MIGNEVATMPRKPNTPKLDESDHVRTKGCGAFVLELDLHVYFEPLMNEHWPGLLFTRTIQLPFIPSTKIAVGGFSLEGECVPPLGYLPSDLIWDVDREVFLAITKASHQSLIVYLPDIIREYLEQGWRLGSWKQNYDNDFESPIGEDFDAGDFAFEWDNESDIENLETQPPTKRSPEFNRLLSALSRLLVQLKNNVSIAYAIYKTKTYFPPDRPGREQLKTKEAEAFREAVFQYQKMDGEHRLQAEKNILRRAARFTK